MRFTQSIRPWLVFALSVLVGALIWNTSPYFTGKREPWDTLTFYSGTLLIGGFVAGLVAPRRFWLWAVAIWLGQCIGFFWCVATAPRVGPLAPLGFILFLPMYSGLSLFGSALGSRAGLLLMK